MQIFIAGVMQGSRSDRQVMSQHYRQVITRVLQAHIDQVKVIDPWALNPGSDEYDDDRARETFMGMTALAGQVDLLVAYVPEASMGTAIEMWEAYRAGVPIVSISPMTENWVVKLLSNRVLADLPAFEDMVANHGLASMLDEAR
jgi:hypothetical protein